MNLLAAEGSAVPPRHHARLETLAEYAAGQMRPGFDLVVAAHLRNCAQCRGDVAQFEALGGELLGCIEPVRLEPGNTAAIMARLDEPASPSVAEPPVRSLDLVLASARRRWIAPGIWVAPVATPHHPDDRVFLLRMAKGTVPYHNHSGAELVQVLAGALSDGDVTYHAGDLVEPDHPHAHSPQVAGDEPCICLFAVHGRLKPTSWLGSIAFAITGI